MSEHDVTVGAGLAGASGGTGPQQQPQEPETGGEE